MWKIFLVFDYLIKLSFLLHWFSEGQPDQVFCSLWKKFHGKTHPTNCENALATLDFDTSWSRSLKTFTDCPSQDSFITSFLFALMLKSKEIFQYHYSQQSQSFSGWSEEIPLPRGSDRSRVTAGGDENKREEEGGRASGRVANGRSPRTL